MNARRGALFAAILLASAALAFCQPTPANDNFAQRIVLTGDSVMATGTVAGATLESGEPAGACSSYNPGGSVWWTWTATISSAVVIGVSQNVGANPQYPSGIQVFSGTNLDSLTLLDCNYLDGLQGRYVRFGASAGTSYQIRVAGGGVYGGPVMVVPPRNCTNSAFGAAFFSVVTAGIPTPSLQWKFNGAVLGGETNVMLAVYNVLSNQAGVYSVVASNSGGITESAATLAVLPTDPVPRLAALAPDDPARMRFTLSGEVGRWYKIQSSSNVVDWQNPGAVLYTNVSGLLSVPRFDSAKQFVRAAVNGAADVCGARMKQWRVAMQLCAIENRLKLPDVLLGGAFRAYFPGETDPRCPDGGTYVLYAAGSTNVFPTCTLASTRGHVMVDPP